MKSLNPPKDVVELALQALHVGPHEAGKASQEKRKEESANDILIRPAHERQKTPFNKSGQGRQSMVRATSVVRFAYSTVKTGVMWCLSTTASDDTNDTE